jgi:hypothetical protein
MYEVIIHSPYCSTFDEVVGRWQIFEGERGGDLTVDCANVQLSWVWMLAVLQAKMYKCPFRLVTARVRNWTRLPERGRRFFRQHRHVDVDLQPRIRGMQCFMVTSTWFIDPNQLASIFCLFKLHKHWTTSSYQQVDRQGERKWLILIRLKSIYTTIIQKTDVLLLRKTPSAGWRSSVLYIFAHSEHNGALSFLKKSGVHPLKMGKISYKIY